MLPIRLTDACSATHSHGAEEGTRALCERAAPPPRSAAASKSYFFARIAMSFFRENIY